MRRKNAYVVLGLEQSASAREIKMRYYKLAKETHPDVLARQAREAAAAARSRSIMKRTFLSIIEG